MRSSIFLLASLVACNPVIDPSSDKVYLTAWLDTSDENVHGGDRPLAFSSRLGMNITGFQFAQDLPVPADSFPFPYEQIQALSTDALVLLTVYPKRNPWAIPDADIQLLAQQCLSMNNDGRRVMLRFGPEMNGYWMNYGIAPTRFVALWRRVYRIVKATAPLTMMCWAPNAGNGWPYGVDRSYFNEEDFAIMDTNGNGELDARDDPYSPFYPGDEFVDWVGTSNYHFGSVPPYVDNFMPYLGQFEENLNYIPGDLYNNYSVSRNKVSFLLIQPFVVAETAAAFHVNEGVDPGPGELAIKQAWYPFINIRWRQTITNASFLDAYPQIKMFSFFEYRKFETDGGISTDERDFRIFNNTVVMDAFKADFAGVQDRYAMATYTARLSRTDTGAGTETPSNSALSASAIASFIFSIITAFFE